LQYKVTQGDQIMINRIDIPVQTQILLDKVLLLGSTEYTVIGQPLLPSAKVLATVEEHEKTDKVIIFKKRRRKTYQRKTGHREPYTLLRISDIMGAKKAPM
jgi:large subunit ribosomal protein L21